MVLLHAVSDATKDCEIRKRRANKMVNKYSCEVFLEKLVKMEIMDIFGLATIMNINLYLDDKKTKPKEGADIMIEMCERFNSYSRPRRKTLLKLMQGRI